jgi:glycosyltransferase involved in cell wall biosynthesis
VPSPLVSVIVPCHDRADVIGRAVRSALTQTVGDLEVVVVDDASTDGTAAAVAAIEDPRVRYVARPVRGGGSAARNTGIDVSTGRILAFLDSDDEWLPTKLERQLEVISAPAGPSLVICGFVRVLDGARRRAVPAAANRGPAADRLLELRGGPMTSSIFTIERRVLDELDVRFDESLPALQDLDFAVQLAQLGVPMVGPAEVLVEKHRDPGRAHVFNGSSQLDARRRFLEKYSPWLEQHPQAARRQRRYLAMSEARAGHRERAVAELRAMQGSVGGRRERVLAGLVERKPRVAQGLDWVLRQQEERSLAKTAHRIRDLLPQRTA